VLVGFAGEGALRSAVAGERALRSAGAVAGEGALLDAGEGATRFPQMRSLKIGK